MKSAVIILAVLLSGSAFSEQTYPIRDRAYDFLSSKVANRSQNIVAEGTIQVDGKDYLVTFKAKVSWNNLQKTAEGLVFDQVREIEQSHTPLNDRGQKAGETIKTDRTVEFHYAVAERLTSKSLVGIATMTKNTHEDPTGHGSIVMLETNENGSELYLYASQAGFGESSLDGKNIVPVATASEATLFTNEEGKLQANETLKFYTVDVNKDFERKEVHRFNLTALEAK